MKIYKMGIFLLVFAISFFLMGCNEFFTTLSTITEEGSTTLTETETTTSTLTTVVETTTEETEETTTSTLTSVVETTTEETEETTTSTLTTAPRTAEEILNEVAASLDIPVEISNEAGFFLFYTDEVVTVAWVSDDETVIDVEFMGGEAQMYMTMIHRPESIDVTVTLTATITYGTETKIVQFSILVLAEIGLEDYLMEDVQDLLVISDQIESSMVNLPTSGLNGSVISWELTPTDHATLNGSELTLECVGANYEITLTATLSLEDLTETTVLQVHVAMADYATIESLLSEPNTDVLAKGTVYFFYERGFFLFDETGFLNVYADGDWSSNIALGDEVILSGNMVNGYIGWELWSPVLETIVSSGNPYAQVTEDYVFGVSFPYPLETWIITGRVEVDQSIVYIYSGTVVRIAIIEQSTYNDSYNALKAFAGQTISIQAVNYYFYSTCYGFLYQEGMAGITVVG